MTNEENPADVDVDVQLPPEDSSAIPATLALRSAVLELLAHYEDRVMLLNSSADDDETPVPEFLEEEKTALREGLYESIRHLFARAESSKGQLSIAFYENMVYSHTHERLRKALGYYQGLSRLQEEVRKTNQELGDPKGIEVPTHEVQKLLLSLDEVDFVRRLGTSMGIFQDDLDKIVEHMIVKEFAPMRRRETPRPREED
jgi:hypothetical protein